MMDPQRLAEWRRTHPPIQGADPATDRTDDPPRTAPREGLVRAVMPGAEVRAETRDDGSDGTTLFGHFARFNTWTEIDSFLEGHFLERIAPGATRKTLKEQRPKVLLNHGMDPMLGDRVIATPHLLREDDEGAYYEARLFDGLDPVLLAGLRAGEYGASFRFNVVRDHWDDTPDPSDHNPRGIRERTLKEVRVSEFGPVTFPAYADATAGVRSMTDEVVLGRAVADPDRLERYLAYFRDRDRQRTTSGISVPDTITLTLHRRIAEEDDAAIAAAVRAATTRPGPRSGRGAADRRRHPPGTRPGTRRHPRGRPPRQQQHRAAAAAGSAGPRRPGNRGAEHPAPPRTAPSARSPGRRAPRPQPQQPNPVRPTPGGHHMATLTSRSPVDYLAWRASHPRIAGGAPMSLDELRDRQQAIRGRLTEIHSEFAGQAFPDNIRAEWNDLNEEREANKVLVRELEAREERVRAIVTDDDGSDDTRAAAPAGAARPGRTSTSRPSTAAATRGTTPTPAARRAPRASAG
jgi:HK97 family phage prohead protease